MTKRRVAAAILLICAVGVVLYIFRERTIEQRNKQEIIQAFRSIQTAVDYGGSAGAVAADLTARERLDALSSRSLPPAQMQTVQCLADYLAAYESLASSHSIETTEERQPVAIAAAKKAFACMDALK